MESAKYLADALKAQGFLEPSCADDVTQLRDDIDLTFITVADQMIPEVVEALTPVAGKRHFVHCSGTTPLNVLDALGRETAVLWPIASLTNGVFTDFTKVTLAKEFHSQAGSELRAVIEQIGGRQIEVDSEQRKVLHLGAVIANNLSNFLWIAAERVAQSTGSQQDFGIYGALIREMVEKALTVGPRAAQTGPARRGDRNTIAAHEKMLANEPDIQELYRRLSDAILKEFIRR